MVYYVEDDRNIRELTLYSLTQSGIEAEGFADDVSFRAACERRIPDAILLDIMLPDVDGLEILRRIRSTPALRDVPVMMLTARDTELDTVRALDAGADDYLSKPFGMMEMVSRVRALLRRSAVQRRARPHTEDLEVGSIKLSPERHEVYVKGEKIKLTSREYALLEYLMHSPGIVFSREELLRRVWGWDFDGGSRTVDVHVQTLRAKLSGCPDAIETVRGVGYRLREYE